jgi:hypothetical protein
MTDQTPADGSDLLFGFLAGRQLGYSRSDAGYFRRGTRAVRGRPGSWAMRPGWQRQMFRLGGFAAAGGPICGGGATGGGPGGGGAPGGGP